MKGVKGTAVGPHIQSHPQPSRWLSAPLQVTALGSSGVCLARSVVRGVSVGGRGAHVTSSGLIFERRRHRQSGPGQELGAGQRVIEQQVSRGSRHSTRRSCSSHPRTAVHIKPGAAGIERQRSNYCVQATAGGTFTLDTQLRCAPAAPDAERYTESMKAGHLGWVNSLDLGGTVSIAGIGRPRRRLVASFTSTTLDMRGHSRRAGDRSFPLRTSACRRFGHEIDHGGACVGGSASQCGFGVASMVS